MMDVSLPFDFKGVGGGGGGKIFLLLLNRNQEIMGPPPASPSPPCLQFTPSGDGNANKWSAFGYIDRILDARLTHTLRG